MNTKIIYFLALVTVSSFFGSGCSKTSVTGSWLNSNYNGQPFSSIMVIGLTQDANYRLLWEDMMAGQLRQGGVESVVSSISAFPDDRRIEKEEILDYVNKKGIEGVLVTRLVDTKTEDVYVPTGREYYGGSYSYYNNFSWYFSHSYNMARPTGYTKTQEVVLLETLLYQAKSQDLVWSMSSDTVDARSVIQLMESVSKKVAATLKNDNLIGR